MPTTDRTPTRAFVGWWVLLFALAFIQSPGRVVADTKHDLTANPGGFLSRSLEMWSETMPLGQLQNQAYGYLFPQGAFFAFFDLLPDALWSHWITQGLWWGILLCLAFTGLYRVAEMAGIGSRQSRILAALLYALSPRILTTLGAISSEAWPVALAPWILLPLLSVVLRDGPVGKLVAVRAVLLSGLAVLATGAVNAVSTAAACVPAALVLVIVGFSGPYRGRAWGMFAGWLAACAAVSMWWIVPLLMLGRYSPPFTDFIESSGVTTRWLNLGEVLRGATSWAPFVSLERVGGNALVAEPVLILATMAVTAVGLVGLAMRSMPWRRGWLLIALVGLVAMAAWTTPFGPLAESGRALLDGPLAALRNLHKMDPVLRLPLMLGLAHATARMPWPGSGPRAEVLRTWAHPDKHRSAIAAMLVLIAAAGATAPAWSARLAPVGGYGEVPGHWHQAADWLNDRGDGSRTLVAPSMPFAEQDWGFTRDEPLQPLTDVPWVVRDAVPLVPPEAIRGLDGIHDQLGRGEASESLAGTLRANGIGHVLVRSDVPPFNRGTSLADLNATLQGSPGLRKATEIMHSDGGDRDRVAVTIWEVRDAADALAPRMVDASEVPLVSGGPEVLARLDEVDGDSPVRILHGEAAGTVTDTPARRGRNYGEVKNAVSGILAPDEETGVSNIVPDYPVEGIPLTQTATGGSTLEVSSSASEPYNVGGADPRHSANALVDGDPTTWWEPRRGTGQAEWVEITPPEPLDDGVLTVTAARVPAQVQIRAGGASTSVWLTPGEPRTISLPGGAAETVRITAFTAPAGFALSEVVLEQRDGEDHTPVRVPVVPDASPVVQRWSFGQEIPEGALRRVFTVPEATTVTVDADTCRTGLDDPWTLVDDEPVACGDALELGPGMHEIHSHARWVTLTAEDYLAPDSAAQDAAVVDGWDEGDDTGTIVAADHDRFVWRPVSTNPGQIATLGGTELEPVTVNGWQQGWLVPAGASGDFAITFPAASTWRAGILAGGALAALFALVTVAVAVVTRRTRAPAPLDGATRVKDLPAAVPVVAVAAAAWLVAGLPGLAVAAVIATVGANVARRLDHAVVTLGAVLGAAALTGIGGVLLARDAWPGGEYAGFEWPLQLVLVGALTLVGFAQWAPSQRRAGSSTKA